MKKEIIILFFILSVFLSGCSILSQKCDSGLFTEEGKCCSYVCDLECPNGYVEGSCHCECISDSQNLNNNQDTNIDGLFDDNTDIEPPQLPE